MEEKGREGGDNLHYKIQAGWNFYEQALRILVLESHSSTQSVRNADIHLFALPSKQLIWWTGIKSDKKDVKTILKEKSLPKLLKHYDRFQFSCSLANSLLVKYVCKSWQRLQFLTWYWQMAAEHCLPVLNVKVVWWLLVFSQLWGKVSWEKQVLFGCWKQEVAPKPASVSLICMAGSSWFTCKWSLLQIQVISTWLPVKMIEPLRLEKKH